MSFQFKEKTIVLISPQAWDHIHVSKHHYAKELAKNGNLVFFLPPPSTSFKQSTVSKISENLFVVDHGLYFPYKLRFHLIDGFNWLMKFHINSILKTVKKEIDVVWSFDSNLYANLKLFKAKLAIYHPVDPVSASQYLKIGNSADLIISVSEKIMKEFQSIEKPKLVLNHAVSKEFLTLANKNLNALDDSKQNQKVKFGYFGNLLRPAINRALFIKVISEFKEIEFVLWGPYGENEVINDPETKKFISKLKNAENVKLKGKVSSEVLANELEEVNAFFLTYSNIIGLSDRSNSHKLIEYLCTGYPIVSCLIEAYQNHRELILMPDLDTQDDQIPSLIKKIIQEFSSYNKLEIRKKRIEYALDNALPNQLIKISKFIDQNSTYN